MQATPFLPSEYGKICKASVASRPSPRMEIVVGPRPPVACITDMAGRGRPLHPPTRSHQRRLDDIALGRAACLPEAAFHGWILRSLSRSRRLVCFGNARLA